MRTESTTTHRGFFTAAVLLACGVTAAAAEPGLTLPEARARALAGSADLESRTAEVAVAEAVVTTARALPNPELELEVENLDLPSALRETTLAVSQRFELGGDRRSRRAMAEAATGVARLDLERGRRDLVTAVDRAFAAALGAQVRLALAEEGLRTARAIADTVAELVRAGEVSPVEEVRARTDAALAEADLEAVRLEHDLARTELAALWGADEPDFPGVDGVLPTGASPPDLDAALTSLERLPDLHRWDLELEGAEVARDAAAALAVPDLTLTAGVRELEVDSVAERGWVVGAALPLPLFDRFAGARAEADARARGVRAEREAAVTRLRTTLRAAHRAVVASAAEARILAEEVEPRARETLAAVEEAYRRGKLPLLDLLEARRRLVEARVRLVDSRVRLARSRATLDRYLADDPATTGGHP